MSNRYIAAVSMWGVALGVLVYRYGMLPLGWSSTWRHILLGAAIGLAVAGHHLLKDAKARESVGDAPSPPRTSRPPVPLLFAIGAAGALLAFGVAYLAFPNLSRVAISKRELPGFTLDLPKGDVIEDSFVYSHGKLSLKNVGDAGGVLIVQWQPGGALKPEELQMIAKMLGTALGKRLEGDATLTSVPGPDGAPVDTILFGGDKGTFALSLLTCGARQVMVATGASSEALPLHRRVIASFACRPDPKQEGNVRADIPLVLDLPGWYLAERDTEQLAITDGVTGHLTMRMFAKDFNVPIERLLEPIFEAAGVDVKVGDKQGDRVPMTLNDGADQFDGWATLVRCPRATVLVFGIGETREDLDRLYERVRAARCLRDGEASQEWPAAPVQPPATPVQPPVAPAQPPAGEPASSGATP